MPLAPGHDVSGFAELKAGLSVPLGAPLSAFARLEAGLQVKDRLSLFGFSQVDSATGAQAGLAARVTF